MKRPLLLLLPLLALAAAPARADTIWPPPAHVDEARFTEPAVTIDGETVATLGDVDEMVFDPSFIPDGRSWAVAAQALADDFLLAREAKARGAESVAALVADGLPEPTEDELRAEWARELEETPALGRVEERAQASHILAMCLRTDTAETEAAARARIGALRDRILAGEDFAAVAREASDCPSRDRGGALGWFGRGQMVPEFEQAAFSQPVGETGEPVRTEYGFHLVLVTGREPGRALAFEEVREDVAERRRTRLLEERRRALLEPLRAAARIEYDPACDPANPTNAIPVLFDQPAGDRHPAADDLPSPPAPVDRSVYESSVSSRELCRRANDGDMSAFQTLRTRAFRGDDEAMSLYFWKTDDWWRGYSFFPVTIRSVEPESGERPGAATNWIVELLGGIKVRTADPAATFGAPPGALPGRRLGVRFRNYKDGWRLDGAPSAMSNACVYVGGIEVRPLLPASESEAARRIVYRNLDDLARLTPAGRKELEERIGERWENAGSGVSLSIWYFEDGESFSLLDGFSVDPGIAKAAFEDESPAVTVDGEVVATRSEVAREAIRVKRPTALVAAAFADDFLLEREAKKHGFATAWAFIHEGLDPPTDPDARAFWNELREDYGNVPFEDARKRFLLQNWQTRFAERRAKLLAALRATATIKYAASLAIPPPSSAEQTRTEDAEPDPHAK